MSAFAKSVPKPDPQVGRSAITINGHQYTFGSLAYDSIIRES